MFQINQILLIRKLYHLHYKVMHLICGSKESLGHAVGNSFNAVISVNDEGFANGILKHIPANINEGE